MRTVLRIGLLTIALSAVPAMAHADGPSVDGGIWFEAHLGQRPADADELLAPLRAVFRDRGYTGGELLGQAIARRSLPGISVPAAKLPYLAKLVEAGYGLLSSGEYDSAASRLEAARELAHGAPAFIVRDDSQRSTVLKALIGLTMAYRRSASQDDEKAQDLLRRKARQPGAKDEAKKLMEDARQKRRLADEALDEALRSFTTEPDPDVYGTEPVEWWRGGRERLSRSGTGTIIVDPGNSGVSCFINEAYAGQGRTQVERAPGNGYRIYCNRGEVAGRVRTVNVAANQVTRVTIDWELDAALRTGNWIGVSFGSGRDYLALRERFAREMAATTDTQKAILVGFSSKPDGQWVYGIAFAATGEIVASGQARLGLPDSEARLGNLARLLTGDQEVRDVPRMDMKAAPPPWRPGALTSDASLSTTTDRSPLPRWMPWTAAGVGASALVAGGVFLWMDHRCGGDVFYDQSEGICPTYYDTAPTGWATVAAGALLAGASVTYLVLHRNDQDNRPAAILSAAPARGGGAVSLSVRF